MKKMDPLVMLLMKAKRMAENRKLTRTFVAIDSAVYASGYEIAGQYTHGAKVLNDAGKYLAKHTKEIIPKVKRCKAGMPPRTGEAFERWTFNNWRWFTNHHMTRIPRNTWNEIWKALS